jgi:hypothetical protein
MLSALQRYNNPTLAKDRQGQLLAIAQRKVPSARDERWNGTRASETSSTPTNAESAHHVRWVGRLLGQCQFNTFIESSRSPTMVDMVVDDGANAVVTGLSLVGQKVLVFTRLRLA